MRGGIAATVPREGMARAEVGGERRTTSAFVMKTKRAESKPIITSVVEIP